MRGVAGAYGLVLLVAAAGCGRKPAAVGVSARAPVALAAGVGRANFAITTEKPQAQAFFNQGVAYLYAFNFDEARRSFEQASKLDPAAPMPWWGVAMAVGPNYNDAAPGADRRVQAFAAIGKAETLAQVAGKASARERDYIGALAALYAAGPKDHPLQGAAYADAMRGVSAKFPQDLDAATMYAEALMDDNAWNLWSSTGEPRATTPVIVATLKSVLARDANHVGANHLLIHAVEASRDPVVGLPSAGRLPGLAPAAGHLVHMPSHIFQHTGEYAGSAHANEQAIAVDDRYYRGLGEPKVGTMYYDSYRVHNKYFLVAGCNMAGEDACSQNAAAALAAYVLPAVPAGKMNEWFLAQQPWMKVRFGRWPEILNAEPLPGSAPRSLRVMSLYARACALAATGRVPEAKAAEGELEAAAGSLPKDFPTDFGTPAVPIYKLAGLVAKARVLEAEGKLPEALATWRAAVALQDQFGYSEPPDWYYPVRESLGGALLRAGQPAAAEAVFRADLKKNVGNGRSLFGLWQALVAERRGAEAVRAESAFRAAWAHADTTLSVASL